MDEKKLQTGITRTMINFLKKFEDSMMAAAFAEVGEFDTAKSYLAQSKNSHKRIIYGTNDMEINPAAVTRAISICQRIGAALEILHVLPADAGENCGKAGRQYRQHLSRFGIIKEQFGKAGIIYEFVVGINSIEEEIMHYVSGRRDVMMVVLGLGQDKTGNAKNSYPDSRLMEHLKCPVVLLAKTQFA